MLYSGVPPTGRWELLRKVLSIAKGQGEAAGSLHSDPLPPTSFLES